jgi:hypothetical protein
MPTTESDAMLTLLQEKAVLKQLDEEYASGPKTVEARKNHRDRKRRHAEIGKEIIRIAALAKQKHNGGREVA